MENRLFTTKTPQGSRRLLAALACIVLLASLLAQVISSAGGRIKVENITIDSRGATLSADLYYPAGTDDEDSIPGLIVAHGAGVTKGNMRGIAEEMARRGFVVLNVNGYATGLSEMPVYDEQDMGILDYQTFSTPSGIYDALTFLRTLNFVDKERICLIGHSQGSMRTGMAAMMDCGYLSFNDIMINVLYDTFGESFTLEEIAMDADALAAQRLEPAEMALYEHLKEENRAAYDAMVKAVVLIGTTAANAGPMSTVTVAGHEVQRNCQVNKCVILGDYDTFNLSYHTDENIKAAMHITGDIPSDEWLILDDLNATSTSAGNIYQTSVLDAPELQQAIQDRATWISFFHPETHSRNFFSSATAMDIAKYCEQVLQYNGGELGGADASPVDASDVHFFAREFLNGIAMIAMIAMLVPLAALLYHTGFFAACTGKNEAVIAGTGSGRFWINSCIAAVVGFGAIYYVNTIFAPGLPSPTLLPLFPSWWLTPIFLVVVAAVGVVQLVVYGVLDKKAGRNGFAGLNINIGVVNVLKTLLASLILLTAAYFSLTVIKYLFNQDFRFWMTAFEEMKAEHWVLMIGFFCTMFVQYLVIGAAQNYPLKSRLPLWAENIVAVLSNSVGVWVCCLINILMLQSSGVVFSNWTSSYGFLLFVPITVYVTRRLYQVTRSIWLGAAVNSLLISWMMISTIGYNIYFAQNFVSNFFNI